MSKAARTRSAMYVFRLRGDDHHDRVPLRHGTLVQRGQGCRLFHAD